VASFRWTPWPTFAPVHLHRELAEALIRGELDEVMALYEPDATLVALPDGDLAQGTAAIRAATEPFLELRPRLSTTVRKIVQGEDLALTHARWTLVGTDPDGRAVELRGRGTMVSRRRADGTWGIVIDDPLTPE
jgi:uncharacterized protein (TIGR02246 family)